MEVNVKMGLISLIVTVHRAMGASDVKLISTNVDQILVNMVEFAQTD